MTCTRDGIADRRRGISGEMANIMLDMIRNASF